jgi:hypothetical protein
VEDLTSSCYKHSRAWDKALVILNKFGTARLSQCTVRAVRPGQTYSRTDSGVPGAGNDLITTVTGKTVYVNAKC